jgi:molybdate transport system substrate-binding protein
MRPIAEGMPVAAIELKLLSAVAVRPVLLELLPAFERNTGIKIVAGFELNPALKGRIEGGEPFDVVVLNSRLLDDLVSQGTVAPETSRPFGRVPLGVAIRAGVPKPDLSSVEGLKRTLLGAKSIAYTAEGSSGAHVAALLARLAILDDVTPKLRSVGGGETGHVVARGEAELGIVPVTTILAAAPGAELAGLLPADVQSYMEFAIGISSSARASEPASALIGFLTGSLADETLRTKGMERQK